MNAAKTGFIAEFKTGYLQKETRVEATVTGGADAGLRNSNDTGFAVGRLVVYNSATGAITAAQNVTATSVGTANAIIAQSDDTVRDTVDDYNYTEMYSTLPNLICKNSTDEPKTVAIYKIVDKDDIKIINLDA